MKEWSLTKQAESNWIKDRPVIENNNNLNQTPAMLANEVVELHDAMLVYTHNPTPEQRKQVLQEASDVGLFLMAIFRMLNADMLEEIMEKLSYNSIRYPAAQFQDGDYKQTHRRLKKRQPKIKKEFYVPIPNF